MKPGLSVFLAVLAAVWCGRGAAYALPSAAEMTNTIITSDGPLEATNNGVEAHIVMTENVHLTGTNLEVTCDRLEVFTDQRGDPSATIGKPGGIRRILATGHVVITQEGRKATAGRVEVLPVENKVVLTEEPVVSDATGTFTGSRMIFFRGEQKVVIDNPRIVGGALPNLGFAPQPPVEAPGGATPAPAPDASQPSTPPPAAEDKPAPVDPDPDRPRVTFPSSTPTGG